MYAVPHTSVLNSYVPFTASPGVGGAFLLYKINLKFLRRMKRRNGSKEFSSDENPQYF
jgi:hypothetical protein